MYFVDQALIVLRLDVGDHHLDVAQNSGAVLAKSLQIVHAHLRKVLLLNLGVGREQAAKVNKVYSKSTSTFGHK